MHTGDLVGFVDLGDIDLNHAVLSKVDTLATHVLVVMVRSIVNPLSYTFVTFATLPRLIPKIAYEHINLTKYSCSNVKLAVQVLSSTMGNVLENLVHQMLLKQPNFAH